MLTQGLTPNRLPVRQLYTSIVQLEIVSGLPPAVAWQAEEVLKATLPPEEAKVVQDRLVEVRPPLPTATVRRRVGAPLSTTHSLYVGGFPSLPTEALADSMPICITLCSEGCIRPFYLIVHSGAS